MHLNVIVVLEEDRILASFAAVLHLNPILGYFSAYEQDNIFWVTKEITSTCCGCELFVRI